MKTAISIFLALTAHSFIIEMETDPQSKTCVSEMFNAGEPISIRAKVTEAMRDRYSLYLTIENENNGLLAHKKHELESNNTLLTYNNEDEQTLSICVDNFETFSVTVELDIKFRHHLANLDSSPTSSEYTQIENKISDVTDLVQRSYSYFNQNEQLVDQIVKQGSTLENSLVVVSFVTLGLMAGAGLLQITLIKQDLKNKKLF